MKKILFPMLAVATLLAAPAAYARTMHPTGGWNVIMDGSFYSCFVSDRGATNGETRIAGPYATQAKANAAMGGAAACIAPEPND